MDEFFKFYILFGLHELFLNLCLIIVPMYVMFAP